MRLLFTLSILYLFTSCSHTASKSFPQVGSVLQQNIENFEYCLNKFQKEAGFFNQPINLYFQIDKLGKPISISVVENIGAVEDDLLRSDRQINSYLTLETTKCIKAEVSRLRFPPASKLVPGQSKVLVSEVLQFDSDS